MTFLAIWRDFPPFIWWKRPRKDERVRPQGVAEVVPGEGDVYISAQLICFYRLKILFVFVAFDRRHLKAIW